MPARSILRRLRLDWPLLGKELLEQSARKQMYIIRVVYAFVLFSAFIFYYVRHLGTGPILALGRGLNPFVFLVITQVVTVFLFLPPVMAGAIAQEKERETLGLLFLTDLTPWELVLQKYVGRLIPMMTLLLIALPLLAVAYSLGGVSITILFYSAETLFFTCLIVGALALECSAHQATTFQAMVRCWGLCLAFVTCCSIEPTGFYYGLLFPGGRATPMNPSIFPMFFTPITYLVPTCLFLLRAKQNLEERAFVQRRNPFAQQFKQIDQYWRDIRKLTRAMLRKRDQEAYTVAKQVVRSHAGWSGDDWSLGQFLLAKMQVPNLLAFPIILGFVVLIILFFGMFMNPKTAPFYAVVYGLWIIALLTIPLQSANAAASERMNERLGAILTTPLTSAEILNGWLEPVQRWIQFLTWPFLIFFVLEATVKFKIQDPQDSRLMNFVAYLGISLLTVWIYPRLVQWLCLWIGLRIRSQIRALMVAFLGIVAWCIIPPLLSIYLVDTNLLPAGWGFFLDFTSPVHVIAIAEHLGLPDSSAVPTPSLMILLAIHFALAGGLMWKFRQICLTNADRYLGRV